MNAGVPSARESGDGDGAVPSLAQVERRDRAAVGERRDRGVRGRQVRLSH